MKQAKHLLFVLLLSAAVSAKAQVAIGIAPHPSAQLAVISTTKGFLPPRMDSTQRNAIVSPATGLTIYNSSIKAYQVYNGTAWYSSVHFIGENYGGGIVYHIYDNGQHGLIAATSDNSTGIAWRNGINRNTGAVNLGVKSGDMNTTLIVAAQMPDNQVGNFAAKICADYSVTVGGITYGDWYLPAQDELRLLNDQRSVVGGFSSAIYWSSTEDNINNALAVIFGGFFLGSYAKNDNTIRVRAIRAF